MGHGCGCLEVGLGRVVRERDMVVKCIVLQLKLLMGGRVVDSPVSDAICVVFLEA